MKFENIFLQKKKKFGFEKNLTERNFQILGKISSFHFSSPVFERDDFSSSSKSFHLLLHFQQSHHLFLKRVFFFAQLK